MKKMQTLDKEKKFNTVREVKISVRKKHHVRWTKKGSKSSKKNYYSHDYSLQKFNHDSNVQPLTMYDILFY